MIMERATIKISKRANRYLMETALRLSKKGKRVYVHEIIDEACKRIKGGELDLDTLTI
jgi:hypothetical protein